MAYGVQAGGSVLHVSDSCVSDGTRGLTRLPWTLGRTSLVFQGRLARNRVPHAAQSRSADP